MLRVGVIMGGDSSEREVSLLTGSEFVKHLNKDRYEVVPMDIKKPKEVLDYMDKIDFALLALHGRNGEDGKVQALLEALEIPYSGSGIASSAICMDKNMSKLILSSQGINTPSWVLLKKDYQLNEAYFEGLTYPVIIKPNQGGSSIGIDTAETFDEMIEAIDYAFKFDDEVVVEEFIKGHELTLSMINGEIIPVLSIQPHMTFYDYDAKYHDNDDIQTVAHLDEAMLDDVKVIGEKCWELFKLKTYARIDLIIQGSEVYVIEINTLPGMTRFSHMPKSAEAMGLSYSEMLDKIIEESLTD